jgi:hypothetical protein
MKRSTACVVLLVGMAECGCDATWNYVIPGGSIAKNGSSRYRVPGGIDVAAQCSASIVNRTLTVEFDIVNTAKDPLRVEAAAIRAADAQSASLPATGPHSPCRLANNSAAAVLLPDQECHLRGTFDVDPVEEDWSMNPRLQQIGLCVDELFISGREIPVCLTMHAAQLTWRERGAAEQRVEADEAG